MRQVDSRQVLLTFFGDWPMSLTIRDHPPTFPHHPLPECRLLTGAGARAQVSVALRGEDKEEVERGKQTYLELTSSSSRPMACRAPRSTNMPKSNKPLTPTISLDFILDFILTLPLLQFTRNLVLALFLHFRCYAEVYFFMEEL